MAQLPYYEVDVPMHHAVDRTRRGLHSFTGPAAGADDALSAARAAYDRAMRREAVGSTVPDAPCGGWAVRGLRPDWVLDWHEAAARVWGISDSPI
jgi:hypothetical protein